MRGGLLNKSTNTWICLDNRLVERGSGLVHLAAIACPRRAMSEEPSDLRINEPEMALTCLWCAAALWRP